MNNRKQTPWLLIGLSAAALCLASLYIIRSRKPSLMDSMQQPATGINSSSPEAAPVQEEAETPAATEEKPCVYELTDPCCVDYIKNCTEPCVIKFYTTWCGACHRLSEYYGDVAKEFKGRVTFYSVDLDNKTIMQKIEEAHLTKKPIASIPTLVYLENGKVHEQEAGAPAKDMLIEKIKKTFSL